MKPLCPVCMEMLWKVFLFAVLACVTIRVLGLLLSLLLFLLSVVWALVPYLIVGGLLFAIVHAVCKGVK